MSSKTPEFAPTTFLGYFGECVCSPDYTDRGKEDPSCQHCWHADFWADMVRDAMTEEGL